VAAPTLLSRIRSPAARAAAPAIPAAIDLDPVAGRFDDVARYLRRRERGFTRPWRRWGERRALRKILASCGPVRTVLDCPCGPGRLFEVWSGFALAVVGFDRSPAMLETARIRLRDSGIPGRVVQGRVEDLGRLVARKADLVASIRFAYYFDARSRPELLRILARASRRYVLVQYKTTESWRGRRNLRRGRNQRKHVTSLAEIRAEFEAAGLELLRFETHGPLSDRALALGELRTRVPDA
jgi:SAM-dependent methyltransferase